MSGSVRSRSVRSPAGGRGRSSIASRSISWFRGMVARPSSRMARDSHRGQRLASVTTQVLTEALAYPNRRFGRQQRLVLVEGDGGKAVTSLITNPPHPSNRRLADESSH